jgi:hypothetical protein
VLGRSLRPQRRSGHDGKSETGLVASLFNLHGDDAESIAKAIVGNVSADKATRIVKAMQPLITAKKARGAHAG